MDDDFLDTTANIQSNQLSIASLFWITTALALLLGHAVKQGSDAILQGSLTVGFVLVCGLIVGSIRRDWNNAFFWGGLYGMLAFLAIAGGRLPHWSVGIGWGLVGASVGSCAGTNLPRAFIPAMVFCAALGALAMAVVVLTMRQDLSGMILFDTIIAAIVGGLIKPFTMLLHWIEKESGQPRFVLASWLAICMLIGNYLVPVLSGVER